jgi:serine/threonine protein kinase
MIGERRVFEVGDKISKELTVLGVLDKGADDPVYAVWHHGAWCPMACKVFRSPRLAQREAEMLETLTHPNVVRFLGLTKPANLLMEFLDGPNLSRLIRTHPKRQLDISDAVRIAIHLGAALAYAHLKGILHLDVKPYNVIVAPGGRPVLYDFGTARSERGRRTQHISGTDPYIAPEECLLQAITPAADVFSLGVTLYEMLTGEIPFPQENDNDKFPQTKEPPVPVRQHRAKVPAKLEHLLLRCLTREPESRPTIAELLPALHNFIRRGPPMWPLGFQPRLARG